MKMEEEVLHRFFAGTASSEETDRIETWLDEAPEAHRKQFDEAYKRHVTHIFAAPDIHISTERRTHSRFMKPIYRYVVGMAAVLAIGLGIGYAFFTYRTAQWTQQLTSLEVPAGQHIRLTLSDGSVVELNSGAKIVYPSVFGRKERTVQISGEAMFDVAHDARHPFMVETFACRIKVLGTKFNVIADESSDYFSTALLRGSILITNKSKEAEQVMLEPNRVASWRHGQLTLTEIENPDEYLWPDGIINLSGVPFEQLMSRFEKYFDVKIDYRRTSPPEIKYQRCKVRISEGVEHALEILKLASDFDYLYDKDTNTIIIR